MESRNQLRIHRRRRVRAKIFGTARRPRLSIFRSNKSVYAQIIDDAKGKTLISVKLAEIKKAKNNTEGAKELGKLIARKCKEARIIEAVFDRGGYKYHGKIKALADGAREGGLKI